MEPVTIIAGLIAIGTAVAKGVGVAGAVRRQQELMDAQLRDQQKALRIYKMEVIPTVEQIKENEREIAAAKQVFTQEMAGIAIALAFTGVVTFAVIKKSGKRKKGD